MIITLIGAMSRNRVIGRDNALPWRMPADMRRFRARTMGHAVIMGRRTWESMAARPLQGRTNIVISRDPAFAPSGGVAAHDLDDALTKARSAHPHDDEVFIIGGEQLYRAALPRADRIDLTVIDTAITDGDAYFPEFENDASWRCVREEHHAADEQHQHAYSFLTYLRLGSNAAE